MSCFQSSGTIHDIQQLLQSVSWASTKSELAFFRKEFLEASAVNLEVLLLISPLSWIVFLGKEKKKKKKNRMNYWTSPPRKSLSPEKKVDNNSELVCPRQVSICEETKSERIKWLLLGLKSVGVVWRQCCCCYWKMMNSWHGESGCCVTCVMEMDLGEEQWIRHSFYHSKGKLTWRKTTPEEGSSSGNNTRRLQMLVILRICSVCGVPGVVSIVHQFSSYALGKKRHYSVYVTRQISLA